MNTVTLPATETTGPDYFDIDAARSALASGEPVVLPPMEIVHANVGGQSVVFSCNFIRDPIQKQHRNGLFYEANDLACTLEYLPKGAKILDVGANVGNHALFFALNGADQVIVVEPNPLAMAPLVSNVLLNGLTDVISLESLGVGLAAVSETGLYMKPHDRNLGATKMKRGMGGHLDVHAGDDLFPHIDFDLIKIDVEGMEMEVLAGLENTVSRSRPLLFVEVDDAHVTAFNDWCAAHDYACLKTFKHGAGNANFLMKSEVEARDE